MARKRRQVKGFREVRRGQSEDRPRRQGNKKYTDGRERTGLDGDGPPLEKDERWHGVEDLNQSASSDDALLAVGDLQNRHKESNSDLPAGDLPFSLTRRHADVASVPGSVCQTPQGDVVPPLGNGPSSPDSAGEERTAIGKFRRSSSSSLQAEAATRTATPEAEEQAPISDSKYGSLPARQQIVMGHADSSAVQSVGNASLSDRGRCTPPRTRPSDL
ncbi:uncharacterized protein LOC119109989 [Pollicipes pollicipes]|uniref:uncharacterized protein LOC119109989 n=1 Tax=Pollicipes pollicipes TaxID=41117 RepID=UPI001884AA51|nr:uncharacterized protein LOC119109989 [Pollicipes pollicipes]